MVKSFTEFVDKRARVVIMKVVSHFRGERAFPKSRSNNNKFHLSDGEIPSITIFGSRQEKVRQIKKSVYEVRIIFCWEFWPKRISQEFPALKSENRAGRKIWNRNVCLQQIQPSLGIPKSKAWKITHDKIEVLESRPHLQVNEDNYRKHEIFTWNNSPLPDLNSISKEVFVG